MSDGRPASHEAIENPAGRPETPRGDRDRAGAAPAVSAAPVAPPAWRAQLLVAAVVLAALNLRPAVTSLGALLEEVREGFGMSGAVAGLLTSVPSLCFAAFGVAAPRLARRFGAAAVVCAGMAAIAVGLLARPWTGSTAALLGATALALMGIAVSNILMPVIVKERFPDRVGPMTGLYSMALALGTSSAAALTVPLTGALGGDWRLGLAAWSLLALAAALVWLPLLRDREHAPRSRPRTGAPTPARAPARPPMRSITRSRTAWSLAVFFGLQSTCAYVTMGWLAQVFRDAGVSAGTAGVLLAVSMVMGVPLSFVIPRMAARLPHQGPMVIALGVSGLAGYTGLILAPASGAWLWAVLLGLANCAFPLALTMVGMRARTGEGVGRLSAFAQSTGYLISIPGPVLVGVLYQHSGGWSLPLTLMAALMIPQMIFGVLAGRNRTVEEELAPRQDPATAAVR
ncbi:MULTISPECIES: MFS transporter [Streptomyces]|uniref:CynX/NimT family MFS transporter n=1 Tax=Streptomyces TaxID=1883 RepID=UPI001409E93F|nr:MULTISPECIES: MFS transporter [Streptomyces]MDH6227612.1 CP family cyanate transporter-like MFS transporter [Streptomyces sp. MJP52]